MVTESMKCARPASGAPTERDVEDDVVGAEYRCKITVGVREVCNGRALQAGVHAVSTHVMLVSIEGLSEATYPVRTIGVD